MKIAAVQQNYTIGDFDGNGARILDAITRLGDSADLIVFPELAVTGYYPDDCLLDARFLEQERTVLARIRAATLDTDAAVMLGHTGPSGDSDKPLHNMLSVFRHGERIFSTIKRKLPTYSVFDERRHFAPGGMAPVCFELDGTRIGALICEDGWTDRKTHNSADPVAAFRASHPDVIVHVLASLA